MTYMNTRSAQIGFVALAVTILTAGLCGEAAARSHKGWLHAHGFVSESSEREPAERIQLASQQPAWLGPMRYYGGPKSPMWREVR